MQSPLAWPPRPSDKIDAAVAGFAGLALAFAFVAMPDGIFARLIVASGLPGIVPAAAPPLGQTARAAVAAAAGIGGFLALFLLLRTLGGKPSHARSRPRSQAPAAPRVRRADAHPDAPSRAPLLAGAELGEPLLGHEEPLELDQQAEEEPIDLPWRMAEAATEPDHGWPLPEPDHAARAAGHAPELVPFEREPLPGIDDLPEIEAEDDFDVSRLPEWKQQEVRAPAFGALPQIAEGSDGIPDLVARFERGLKRRATVVEPVETARPNFGAPAADPLADAISGLERLANKRP